MCKKMSLKDWKPDETLGDLSKYAVNDIYPEDITIKIHKCGFITVAIGDIAIGQIQELVCKGSVDPVGADVDEFHVKQISLNKPEDQSEYMTTVHEFDGVLEFIEGQKLINAFQSDEEEE